MKPLPTNFTRATERSSRLSLLRVVTLGLTAFGLIWSGSRLMSGTAAAAAPEQLPPRTGGLLIVDKRGATPAPCPLKRTEVQAEISGFLNRVTVTQQFENPLQETIEAVYTFPLPQNSAVDDMTMLIGDRTVKGLIKPREEARAIYEAARNAGRTASLLEQERANIFTQSVTNIKPGEKVKITISYVEAMKYEAGNYEFVFPMVVGPRYIPGQPVGKQGGGWAPDTTRVPDASRITPPVTPPSTRAGHDITIQVAVDAGVPIDRLSSTSHEVDVVRPDSRRAVVKLRNHATIPNKDFVLRYDVAGSKIEDAVLTHRAGKDGYFTLILQPPDRVVPAEVTPKELVFVLDTSGSMHGFPMDKSKEVMRMALATMNPQDTFNIITFAGDTHILFPEPVAATPENVQRAQAFVEGRRGGGGTEMMKAIRAALDPTDSLKHVRVVAFLTDGYIGNDMEIIAEIKKHSNARVFSFGIGNSVNRFLLDKMAEHGRGEVEYVMLSDDGTTAAKRFYERIRNPLLTDIQIDFGGMPVADVYPKRIPDLFSAKPVVMHGRYAAPGKGTLRISGKLAGKPYQRTVNVDLPANEPRHDVLATLWARTRIEDLMAQDYAGAQNGTMRDELKNQIIRLGLDFRLMTQFTAFVAVELKVVNEGGKVRRIEVPVEMPEGVSYEGVFGERKDVAMQAGAARMYRQAYQSAGAISGRAKIGTMSEARPSAPAPSMNRPPQYAVRDEADSLRPRNTAKPMAQLHPDVSDLVKGVRTNTSLLKNGKAELKLYLSSKDPAVLQSLTALGFEVVEQDPLALTISGRIAPEKVAEIARISGIRYIAPRS